MHLTVELYRAERSEVTLNSASDSERCQGVGRSDLLGAQPVHMNLLAILHPPVLIISYHTNGFQGIKITAFA